MLDANSANYFGSRTLKRQAPSVEKSGETTTATGDRDLKREAEPKKSFFDRKKE